MFSRVEDVRVHLDGATTALGQAARSYLQPCERTERIGWRQQCELCVLSTNMKRFATCTAKANKIGEATIGK